MQTRSYSSIHRSGPERWLCRIIDRRAGERKDADQRLRPFLSMSADHSTVDHSLSRSGGSAQGFRGQHGGVARTDGASAGDDPVDLEGRAGFGRGSGGGSAEWAPSVASAAKSVLHLLALSATLTAMPILAGFRHVPASLLAI
jgi:hypothetical protein